MSPVLQTSPAPARPIPRAGVLAIEAYVPGKSHGGGPAGQKVHKLSSNETPLGASPKAIAALKDMADHLELYPDGSAARLRSAIAARYGLDPDRIVCGSGSDEILSLLTQAYIGPGDEGIFTQHGFLVYKIAILAAGGIPVVAQETDLTANVDAILHCVTPRTKMVFLANPNNPTGTFLAHNEVKRLATSLPPHVLLVLDAAYAEYVTRNDYAPGIELVATSENVVMTRTFSKIYGLASLRLGWCFAPPSVCDALNRIRGPFNINGAAIEAGIAALSDTAHISKAVSHNDQWLEWLTREITALGIRVTPSVGNFLLLHFDDANGPSASEADVFFSSHGLILRMVAAYGLKDCLRLTIGTEEANRLFVQVLAELLATHRSKASHA